MFAKGLTQREGSQAQVSRRDVGEEPVRQHTRTPAVNIHETGEAIIVVADMPGVSEAGTDITIDQGVLTIRGTIKPEAHDGFNLLHQEYVSADFERSFTVPNEIDTAQVSAQVKHGVVRVLLPKAKAAQPRRITVNAK